MRSRNTATGAVLTDTPAENLALTFGLRLPEQGPRMGWRMQAFDDITTGSATTSAPGYALHDLFVTWTPEDGALRGFEVALAVENVTDRAYRNNLSLDNGPGRNLQLTVGRAITW
ncbi:MAG TPA: hypothetical protein VLA78_08750 [Paracoccaceae bacterium]|nr:hypothetical protein [Paracoccaceae bacterium]